MLSFLPRHDADLMSILSFSDYEGPGQYHEPRNRQRDTPRTPDTNDQLK